MIDPDVLAMVFIYSFVLYKVVEAIKDRLGSAYTDLSDRGREFFGYGVVVVIACLMWFTHLDAFPGFVFPIGQVLTCVAAGFGPGLVYDLLGDKPKLPS